MSALTVNPEVNSHPEAELADPLVSCGQMLLSGIASSVLVLRCSERIAFANKAAETMLGKTTKELEGLELSAIFKEELNPLRSAPAPAMTSRRGQLCLDGNARLPVRVDIRPLHNEKGTQLGSVVTIENLSDILQMDEYVKQMLHCDTLTGLPKESTLAALIQSALLELHTTGRAFALLELNIDQFRRIKESLGHDAADGALRETAARLVKATREHDVVTRSSSDAFTILLTNCVSEEDALARANAVMEMFKEPFRFGPYCTHVTASIGVSVARPGTVSSDGMFTEAELAVRRCKALGGNRVVCFEPAMADWHSHAVQMESQMQTALANDEFFVVYQPQVCCQTGRLVGVESLLRWRSPENGLIMPSIFIPAAEESGLIVALGEWCLRAACKEMVSLQQQLGYPVRLAVNVSPKQMHSPGFKDFVRRTLKETGLKPELLELEITEGLLISHEEEALKAINSIQELGVSIAMDDFGMGFSNLSYLNRFKIDRLKIDRSFISRCSDDHNSRMITTSLVFLAKSLGIEVVAEGVETQAQAAVLAELQCDLAQGYLYSRPTTAAEICAMAANTNHACAGTPKHPQAADHAEATALQNKFAAVTAAIAPAAAHGVVVPGVAGSAPAADAPGTPVVKAAPEAVARTPQVPPAPLVLQNSTPLLQPLRAASEAAAPDARSFAIPPAPAGPEARSHAPAFHATREDRAFATHTILVPRSEASPHDEAVKASASAFVQCQEAAKPRRAPAFSTGDSSLEPREPVCRPMRPKRPAGSTRVRWTAVMEGDSL